MNRASTCTPPESPLAIRIAQPSEHAALEALQTRASLNNPGDRAALLANPDAIALPIEQIARGEVHVAECAGAIVGFAAIVRRDDGDLELDGLFVEPDRWRRGIGRRLIERCIDVARERGATAIHVIGNPHAMRFYELCGFQACGTTQTRFGPGVLMRRDVCPETKGAIRPGEPEVRS